MSTPFAVLAPNTARRPKRKYDCGAEPSVSVLAEGHAMSASRRVLASVPSVVASSDPSCGSSIEKNAVLEPAASSDPGVTVPTRSAVACSGSIDHSSG